MEESSLGLLKTFDQAWKCDRPTAVSITIQSKSPTDVVRRLRTK